MAKTNTVFLLSERGFQKPSDYDVVMLYEVLLGRNPESSAVIQAHRTRPFNEALRVFLGSSEFRDGVLRPLETGGRVTRQDSSPGPSTDQLNWLIGRAMFDETQKTTLRQAGAWEKFFEYLCSLDGFLDESEAAAPPAAPATAAVQAPPHRAEPAPAAVGQPGLIERLDRIEALLTALTLALRTAAETQAGPVLAGPILAAPVFATPVDPEPVANVQAENADLLSSVKARSRRQAR